MNASVRRPRGLAAVTVGVAVAFFAAFAVRHLWNPDGLAYELDQAHIQYAKFVIMHEALTEHGAFPHWQHMLYAGAPFHANPESACLYPLTLPIAALFEPIAAMNLFTVLHTALAALGMFVLVRDLAKRRASIDGVLVAPLVAGLCFAANVYFRRESINLVTYGATHALLPFAWLAVDRVLTSERPRRAAAVAALVLAALVHTGGTYVIVFGALVLAAWVLWRAVAGGADERRRVLVVLPLVGLLALVLTLGKLLPMFAWLPDTNRTGAIPIESLTRRSLAGADGEWSRYWPELLARIGGWFGATLLVIAAVCGRRIGACRFAFAVALVAAVLAFGTAYEWLYHLGAPFDRIRTGAERVWLVANLTWPLALGLGLAALERRIVRARLADLAMVPRVALGAGFVLVAGAFVPPLAYRPTEGLREHLGTTHPRDEVVARYASWIDARDTVGDTSRVWWVAKRAERTLGGRNEQLPVAALGLESPAGFLGYIWPLTLAEHLYLDTDGETLPVDARLRRAGVLAVSHVVPSRPNIARQRTSDGWRFEPQGVEVGVLEENPWFRPRVVEPRAVVAVIDPSGDRRFVRALRDRDLAPDLCLVELASAEDLDALGASTFDGVVAPTTVDLPASVSADRAISTDSADAAARFVELVAEGRPRNDGAGRLLRLGPNAEQVLLDPVERARWIVVAERWADAPGWRLEADGAALDARPADGAVTALFVPAGTSLVTAVYAAPGFALGMGASLAGLLLALGLVLWPVGASARD